MLLDLEEKRAVLPNKEAQTAWAALSVAGRVRFLGPLRNLIATEAPILAAAVARARQCPLAEKLVSEVLPLAEACRWLEGSAAEVLKTQRHGSKKRPFWLPGISFEVQRQAFGTVLIIGPGNYPLFLPAVQILHALVAGNTVLLKPAPGTRDIMLHFARLTQKAGLNPALLTILPESIQAARDAIARGVDKVIFTGSSENGRAVLTDLAETNTPAITELSGEDPVVILADADLDLVVRALRFGTQLNNGETCMAPRQLIVQEAIFESLCHALAQAEIPKLPMHQFCDIAEAVDAVNTADFGLGATIFTENEAVGRDLARQLQTGFVLINDLIMPTADPRMPFGGVRQSGFGVTRGAEGLLEMTHPHVVMVRSGRFLPHFDEPTPDDVALFSTYLLAAHGPGSQKWSARWQFLQVLWRKIQNSRKTSSKIL